jgi:hypothetical protein
LPLDRLKRLQNFAEFPGSRVKNWAVVKFRPSGCRYFGDYPEDGGAESLIAGGVGALAEREGKERSATV